MDVSAPAENVAGPPRLFRYFSSAASDLLATQQLWVSAASDFNDVFEVVPRYDKFIESQYWENLAQHYAFLPAGIQVSWPEYKRSMRRMIEQAIADDYEVLPDGFQKKFSAHFGIVCFSTKLDCLLMWGHYASSHAGFVIEFDPGHPIFDPTEFGKVGYSEERPIFNAAGDHRKTLLNKSVRWEYEQEYRLVKKLPLLPRAVRRDKNEKHYIPLPLEAVKAVYIGLRMPNTNRDELLGSLKLPGRQHVIAYGMRRHHANYAIEPVLWKDIRPAPPDAQADFESVWKAIGL